jgi:hypothetical protein
VGNKKKKEEKKEKRKKKTMRMKANVKRASKIETDITKKVSDDRQRRKGPGLPGLAGLDLVLCIVQYKAHVPVSGANESSPSCEFPLTGERSPIFKVFGRPSRPPLLTDCGQKLHLESLQR